MIKLAFLLVISFLVYVAIGAVLPVAGSTAIVFPTVAAIPAVGAWLCFLTYKGIAAIAVFGALGKRI